MDLGFASWFVILLAVLAANLPFFNERLFAIAPVGRIARDGAKPFWLRLLELFVLYFFVGAVARLLEGHIGSVYAQGWEFFAVTGCLFIVLAFPGYVFRYLRKHRD